MWPATCAEFTCFSPGLNHARGRTGRLFRLVISAVLFHRAVYSIDLVIYSRTESPQCLVIAAPAVRVEPIELFRLRSGQIEFGFNQL